MIRISQSKGSFSKGGEFMSISNDKSKHIVVLGGGYGGVLTAKKLAKKFKKDESVKITLIDKKPYHTLLTELHEVAANRAPEDSIRIDLKKIFAKRKVDVVLDEIQNIDFEKKELVSESTTYSYDVLVVGSGSKPTFFGTKGAEEFAKTLWSFEDAVDLKHHILSMFRLAAKTPNREERRKLLSFVVVGGGFTGVEMIGELGEWKDQLCKEFYISEDEVSLKVVDVLPTILPIFPKNLIEKAEKRLRKLGVELLTGTGVIEVGEDFVVLKDGTKLASNTVIWAAGVEGSEIMETVDTEKNGRNRLVANSHLQSVKHDDVFVVGDNVFYIPKDAERPVPQMVENAEHSAKLVAKNVTAKIKGEELSDYEPEFHGAMVCIGGRYGVAHLGKPGKFFGLSGFLAMFVKHFINVVYFFQVAGFNKCWTYLIHEFFHVKNNRSMFGGHFAKSSPNFWLVPLRLFVGFKWLTEGLAKVPSILNDPSNIFLLPSKMDAVAGASQAAESAEHAVEAVQALPVPEFIQNIVDWSMNLMFYNVDGSFTPMASIFQAMIVLCELTFGILLIVGLFTALSSIGTVLLGMAIWSSGMAPTEMLWYLAGGVALIGGSGSTFGMDYYVMPFLKKHWKKVGFAKKWYLYTD